MTAQKVLFPLILILILSPLCFYGFDFTDLGYHITNQFQAADIGMKHLHFNPYWGGSDIIGGLWIKTFGIDLWVIRFFPILIYAACLSVLSLETKPSHLFPLLIVTLFSASPMPSGMILLADYYTLPMLGITCWTLIWFRLNNSPPSVLLLMALTVISFLTTFLRLPLIALMIIPFCMYIYERKFRSTSHWVIFCIAGLMSLFLFGIFEYYFVGLKQQSMMLEKTSGMATFVHPFFRHLKENLLFFLQILAVAFFAKKFFKKTFFLCLCYIYLILFTFAILDVFSVFQDVPVIRGIAHSCFKRGLNCLHLLMFFAILKGIIKERNKLYLLPIALMPFILNFGTNTGISKMNYLLPCTYFCLIQLYEINLNKKVLIGFFILSIPWNYKNFYRDGHFFEMSSLNSDIGKLRFLKTSENTERKIMWIEGLSNRYQLKKKSILSYPSLASIYYLNNSSQYMGYPWSHFIKNDLLLTGIKEDCSSGKLKAIFIDQEFQDSPKLISYVFEHCQVKFREKHDSTVFLSF